MEPCPPEVAELLLNAAKVIERDGWCQHSFSIKGTRCLVAALWEAGDYAGDVVYNHAKLRLLGFVDTPSVVGWNDVPGRTQAEVMALLCEAAL